MCFERVTSRPYMPFGDHRSLFDDHVIKLTPQTHHLYNSLTPQIVPAKIAEEPAQPPPDTNKYLTPRKRSTSRITPF